MLDVMDLHVNHHEMHVNRQPALTRRASAVKQPDRQRGFDMPRKATQTEKYADFIAKLCDRGKPDLAADVRKVLQVNWTEVQRAFARADQQRRS